MCSSSSSRVAAFVLLGVCLRFSSSLSLHRKVSVRRRIHRSHLFSETSSSLETNEKQAAPSTSACFFNNVQYPEDDKDSAESGLPVRKEGSVAAAVTLVCGTTVGAGILALPAVSLNSGAVPSSAVLVLCWMYMVASGLLIAEVNMNAMFLEGRTSIGVLRMAKTYLGTLGANLASAAYLFIHYCLLVAYIAQGGAALAPLFGSLQAQDNAQVMAAAGPVAFTALFGGLLAFGSEEVVESANGFFVVGVLVSFAILISLAVPGVDVSNLSRSNWSLVAPAVPTMFVALVYHNVVPSICASLEGDRRKVRLAIVGGTAVPLVMFLLWNAVILGNIDAEAAAADIKAAVEDGVVFDPLQALGNDASLGVVVSVFSELAVVTSFIGFVVGLRDFIEDSFFSADESASVDSTNENRGLSTYGLVLLPPLAFALVNPTIFFGALDIAGSFGISVLFGILPAIMAWKQRDVLNSRIYESKNSIAAEAGAGSTDESGTLRLTPLLAGGRPLLVLMVFIPSVLIAAKLSELAHVG